MEQFDEWVLSAANHPWDHKQLSDLFARQDLYRSGRRVLIRQNLLGEILLEHNRKKKRHRINPLLTRPRSIKYLVLLGEKHGGESNQENPGEKKD